MNFIIIFLTLLFNTSYSASTNYGISNFNNSQLINEVKNISLSLSNSNISNLNTNNRLCFNLSKTNLIQKSLDWDDIIDFNFSFRVSKNLSFLGKYYSLKDINNSPQVYGLGIKYDFKVNLESSTSFILQNSSLKGVPEFRLSTTLVELRHWYYFNNFNLLLSAGNIEYGFKSYSKQNNQLNLIKDKVNFIGLDIIRDIFYFGIGASFKTDFKYFIYKIYLTKSFY